MKSKLFTPVTFGPLTLRNRTIRSAAFESMCPGNTPSQMLLDYHRSVAAGGVGMTTVAYAAVTQSGLSFDRQLWMRPSIISRLNELTKAVHDEGAAVGIQIGHCGNMSHKKICGVTPISASSGFNLYSPTFVRGMEIDESIQVAKRLLELGAHGLVLSGGFVSKAPMYVMRGAMPIRSMAHYMDCWWLKYGVRMFGKWMIPSVPFEEAYFLKDALKFREALPEAPLIYVGGLVARQKIDEVLDAGFEAVQMGRALLNEPGFVNRMKQEEQAHCNCGHSNYCIGRMYSIEMACHQHLKETLPPCLQKEIEKLEKK